MMLDEDNDDNSGDDDDSPKFVRLIQINIITQIVI